MSDTLTLIDSALAPGMTINTGVEFDYSQL